MSIVRGTITPPGGGKNGRGRDVGELAADAFRVWIAYRYEAGLPIPDPSLATDDVPTPEWDTAGVTSSAQAGVAT